MRTDGSDMGTLIERLVARGMPMKPSDDVLFDTAVDAALWCAVSRSLDEMMAGARVEVEPTRTSDRFRAVEAVDRASRGWESPWGRGVRAGTSSARR